jgi:mono/diheme cytochrome c family protein
MNRSTAWGTALCFAAAMACGGGEDAEMEAEGPEAPPAAAPAPAPTTPAAPGNLPEGVTAEMAAAGATLYAGGVCAACHGPTAEGVQGLGPNLTDATWLNIDGSFESIVQVITNGVPTPKEAAGPMPPKGGNASLTDEQVRQLAAHVYAVSHP